MHTKVFNWPYFKKYNIEIAEAAKYILGNGVDYRVSGRQKSQDWAVTLLLLLKK